MLKLSHLLQKCTKNGNRFSALTRLNNFSSSPTIAETKSHQPYENEQEEISSKTKVSRRQSSIVAAAFASLQTPDYADEIKTPFTDAKIFKAKSVDELLSISEGSGVSRRHALKVVQVLAEWSSSGKTQISEFENDSRFIRLCKILMKNAASKKIVSKSEDLSTILNITADDEAAKLVANITLPQMVKVMSTLCLKKRRSTLLLRALSFNITASQDRLNLKQCADLLFSMASLNFLDENLFNKIINDVIAELENVSLTKSSAIGSIITSFGLLKYKNPEVLDSLSSWILNNVNIVRPQDLFSLFMTLAVLNYYPSNSDDLFGTLISQLTFSEAGKRLVWLDIVWSLILLNKASNQHISSILSLEFINGIEGNKVLSPSTKLKILNIDAAAKYLLSDYTGDRLPENSSIRKVQIPRSKDKIELVDSVVDSLRNLIQSENHLKTNINTGLGFFIDAECLLDKKCSPLSLEENLNSTPDATRVAILVHDYHDICKGKSGPTGINLFINKLLEAQGYKVLVIPYNEYKTTDKLIYRVQHIEAKLKEIVKS